MAKTAPFTLRNYLLTACVFLLLSCMFPLAVMADVSVCLVSPIGSEVYRSGDSMTISWRATNTPECAWQVAFSYKWSGSSTEHFIGVVPYSSTGTYNWEVPYVDTRSYMQIVVKLLTDGDGICDSATSNSVIIFPASAPSTLYLSNPQPNPCDNHEIILSAGESYEITWDVTGCMWNSPFLNIYYATEFSPFEGYNWQKITPYGVNCANGSFTWTVPNVDTTNARIKLEWNGHEATHIYPFTITPNPVNHCPVADAGDDQTVNEFETVYLDGSGSSDPEGDDISYQWEFVNPDGFYESGITIHNASSSMAYFTAPNVPVEVNIEVKLTVTATSGCDGSPDEDITTVTVRPLSPHLSHFTPLEGWFKTPITLYGDNLGGSRVYMDDTEVWHSAIPLEDDNSFTFFLPDFDLGSMHITVGTSTHYTPFHVIDVPYQWNWGFKFHNPGEYLLSWSDYERCFGHDAVTWKLVCCDWDGLFCRRACHDPIAQAIFDSYVESLAWPGTCWGMSVTSLKFLYGDLELPFGAYDTVRDLVWNNLDPDTGITREIRHNHISQISAEVIGYLVDHLADTPYMHLERVMADTDNWRDKSSPDYHPGVICIQHVVPGAFDNFSGHTMVPDHVEEVSPNVYRIYVYDSNREEFSTSRDNTDSSEYARITDFDNYPYITVDVNGYPQTWSFDMGSSGVWEASTDYNLRISTEHAEMDIPFYGLYYFPASVSVRDNYTFPLSLRGIGMILFGSADSGIVEDDGDRLGYDKSGKLHFEIANGIPLTPFGDGTFHDQEFYVLPDGDYNVEIYGLNDNGAYDWQCINRGSMMALHATSEKGDNDLLAIGRGNSDLRITTNAASKIVSLKMVKSFEKGGRSLQRVFEILDLPLDMGGSAWFRVTPDLKSLVYENSGNKEVVLRTKFTQAQLGPQPEPPEQPVDIDDLVLMTKHLVAPGNAVVITPIQWDNLSGSDVSEQVFLSGELPDCQGDFDYDGDSDGSDIAAFAAAFSQDAFEADIDKDGDVNGTDIQIMASQFAGCDR